MKAKQYYFSGRLIYNPQTWIETWKHTPGFIDLEDCKKFCSKILFGYTIYSIDEKDKKITEYESKN